MLSAALLTLITWGTACTEQPENPGSDNATGKASVVARGDRILAIDITEAENTDQKDL